MTDPTRLLTFLLPPLAQAFGGAPFVGLSCSQNKATGIVSLNMVELCFRHG